MTASLPLRVLYFAWLRERIGIGAEDIALPERVSTVAELVAWLRARGGGYEAAFGATASIRCAVNQEFAAPETELRPGDEVAFFPPVTGG